MFQFSWKWRTNTDIYSHALWRVHIIGGQRSARIIPPAHHQDCQSSVSVEVPLRGCPSTQLLSLASTNVTLAFRFQLSSWQQTTFSPFMQRLTEKLVKAIFGWFPRFYLLSHLQSNRPSVHGWQHSCSSHWSEGTLPPPPSSSCGPSQIPPSPYPTCVGEEGRRREEKRTEEGGGKERRGREERGTRGQREGCSQVLVPKVNHLCSLIHHLGLPGKIWWMRLHRW